MYIEAAALTTKLLSLKILTQSLHFWNHTELRAMLDLESPRGTPGRLPAMRLALILLFRAAAGLAPAPSTTSRTYLASLSPPAAEAEARAAAPARRPRAAEALREKRAAEAPYLDGLDRRQWLTTAFARERGEAGRYLATLNERGAANKLNELRSREAATTDYYLEGLDRRGWTATAFSRELERRRREKLTVARKPSMVTLVEDLAHGVRHLVRDGDELDRARGGLERGHVHGGGQVARVDLDGGHYHWYCVLHKRNKGRLPRFG